MNVIETIILLYLLASIVFTAFSEPKLSLEYWSKCVGSCIKLGRMIWAAGTQLAASFGQARTAVNETGG